VDSFIRYFWQVATFSFVHLDIRVQNVTTLVNSLAHTGSFSSYLVPAAALGAMGYCYMWWQARFLMLKIKTISSHKC
jgi:hypothetical protein